MMNLKPPYREAVIADALALAELVNFAGEGLPLYLWSKMAGHGQSPWEVGRERASRESGSFSYRNAIVRDENGKPVACLVGYPLEDDPRSGDYSDMPPMFVPMQELEDQAAGTWYVNVLATYPEYRNKGYGHEMLLIAATMARETKRTGLSLIVSDGNESAIRLYLREGFREQSVKPMVKEQWENRGENWVLMVKDSIL